jgi:hypothetical protein
MSPAVAPVIGLMLEMAGGEKPHCIILLTWLSTVSWTKWVVPSPAGIVQTIESWAYDPATGTHAYGPTVMEPDVPKFDPVRVSRLPGAVSPSAGGVRDETTGAA